MKNKMKELIKKHGIYLDDGIKNSIDEVEYKQAAEVCDTSQRYMELEMLKVHFYDLYIKEFKENKLDKYIDKLELDIDKEEKVYVLLDESVWDDEPCTRVVGVALDKTELSNKAKEYIKSVKEEIDFENLEISDDEACGYVVDADEEDKFSIYLNGYYNNNHINISIVEKELTTSKAKEIDNSFEF